MAKSKEDKRKLHALRRHIDVLVTNGARVTKRDPLTLQHAGQTLRVKHGMLIGYYDFSGGIESITDHDWPDTLRQMAANVCTCQLDEALKTVDTPTDSAHARPSIYSSTESIRPTAKTAEC